MRKIIWVAFIFLTGCASTFPMTKVIDACNSQNALFKDVAWCIRETYSRSGNTPNANSVKAFYAELDVINELLANKRITEAQAKAGLYRAYSKTIGAANQANQGVVCMPINGMMFCQ